MPTSFPRTWRAALALAAAVSVPTAALASTAANTAITNTATVHFNDAGGNPQTPITASATVTVTLVPSAVLLSSPVDQTIAMGTSATLSYTITGTANGPDTYKLGVTANASNLSAVTPTFPANVTLGGTTLANPANPGDGSITVPYDGVAALTSVNGIAPGATIVIGGNVYTVAAAGIAKNSAANTATITLTSAITGTVAVPAGSVVGEQKTFTVTVPSGTVTSGNSGTQTVSTTATSTTTPNPATPQATPTVVTVNRPALSVQKLVSTDNGVTFLATGSAAPNTVLIYKIIATNSGSSAAQAVTFTDVVPAYLTYQGGSGKYATSSATTYAAATALTEGSGGYTYTAGTSTIDFNPGGATGTVAAGGVLVLFYQAKIN